MNHTSVPTHPPTHTHSHTAVMNYRALSLTPWPRTSSHDTRIYHFVQGIDPSTAIWHKHTGNQTLLPNIPSLSVPQNLHRHPPYNGHQFIDAGWAKTQGAALSSEDFLNVLFDSSKIIQLKRFWPRHTSFRHAFHRSWLKNIDFFQQLGAMPTLFHVPSFVLSSTHTNTFLCN